MDRTRTGITEGEILGAGEPGTTIVTGAESEHVGSGREVVFAAACGNFEIEDEIRSVVFCGEERAKEGGGLLVDDFAAEGPSVIGPTVA